MDILRRLIHLANEQREALHRGQVECFTQLMDERTRLFETLRSMVDTENGFLSARQEFAELSKELLRLDMENATTLQSLMQDLADGAERLAREEVRSAAYLRGEAEIRPATGRILEGRP